jgi:glycosyltransferase involved in cell wall biosynthesis
MAPEMTGMDGGVGHAPYVSVIVPVRNGQGTIGDCLSSLLRTDYPADRREILVVDNGSTDRTAEIVKGLPVGYLGEERRGAPAARNRGITASRGELIAFTDADCVVAREWLSELARGFDDGAGGVAGEVFPYPPATAAERYAARTRSLSPQKYLSRPVLPFAAFANLAFRRDVFDRVGLLDEAMTMGAESTDFCTRVLRETGLRIQYAPRAVVFHRYRRTAREFARQQWNYGRGHALLHLRYQEEIPWGWRRSLAAYREVARASGALVKSAWRYAGDRGDERREDLHFSYFEFLKRVGERLGFVRQSLSRGQPCR